MTDPIITSGVTDGARWAQLWHPAYTAAGKPSPLCVAWMGDSPTSNNQFSISSACPTEWIQHALDTFETFRTGTLPTPTHTQTWAPHGHQPHITFEPIELEGEAT